jgi:phosphoribosylanthranilate isomerase
MSQALHAPIANKRVRIKICGITRVEDALNAVYLGADALGLVFYPQSPRAVSVMQAQAIVAALPPFVSVVGLFVNATAAEVAAIQAQVRLDVLQFHGDECAEYCAAFHVPYLKALRMQAQTDLIALAHTYASASALLLDTYVAGVQGGTGAVFDWAWIPRQVPKPLIIAGGLNPANVAHAIALLHPWGVDVSGGVEAAKGIKDAAKMAAFMAACDAA